jgi:hypothetical protein
LNFEPWHGQCNSLPAGATVQPMCVHLALNAATVSPVGRDTIAALPSGSVAFTHMPTWMSATLASAGLAGAELAGTELAGTELADCDAAGTELAGCDAAGLVPSFVEELELQAAKATAPAPAAPAARTERRVTVGSVGIEQPPVGERCRV